MRVATLNLWARSGAWPDRRRVPIDGFRELAPDVVLFQEAEGPDHVTDLLGPDFHVAHRGWIAIAARRPLGAVRELELPPMPRAAGFAAGTLIAETGDLLVVNHFPPWAPEHEAHTLAAARLVEQVAPRNPLVMEESDVTREEPRRIDYLFVRAGARGPCLNIVDCRLIFEEPVASDHYGVMAELESFGDDQRRLVR